MRCLDYCKGLHCNRCRATFFKERTKFPGLGKPKKGQGTGVGCEHLAWGGPSGGGAPTNAAT